MFLLQTSTRPSFEADPDTSRISPSMQAKQQGICNQLNFHTGCLYPPQCLHSSRGLT